MKEKIQVRVFTEEFINRKISNNRATPNAIEDFINEKLDITTYLPFNTKREIVDMLVAQIITEEDGVKRVNSVAQFLSFIVTMVASHTTLAFSDKPEEDYDALSKCGVLEHILAMFSKDYAEIDALLKAAIADELVDNNLNIIVGKFLNGILDKFYGVIDILKNLDLSKLLGTNINEEEKAKFLGLIDKLKK